MTDFSNYSWGPSLTDNGVRFRLWAPSEKAVQLSIGGSTVPMMSIGDGWFEVEIPGRPFGAEYGFVLSDRALVPDPASRYQNDVLGRSRLIDPDAHEWKTRGWRGRDWEEAVFYEIHMGTFTPEGTFEAAGKRLAGLADIGFTAIEIMPLAHFPGKRGWGYDGVFHYAPFSPYGSADDFKAFVDTAHGLGLMVFLDVVYNHLGPKGNFLPIYAPGFFQPDNPTPWGPRIDFACEPARRFYIENAIYWLTEFRLDGLRFDSVNQIDDESEIHILEQMAREAYASVPDRQIHLIVENTSNGIDLIAERPDGRRLFKADWNDDFHHAVHSAATGEDTGHYRAFSDEPWKHTARSLAEGYLVDGKRTLRTVEPPPPASLPTVCFIHFLQNHDQVGNRALGDRLHTGIDGKLYAALIETLLLSPQIPLFFQGDDHLSSRPFLFFADYEGELRKVIWEGREQEVLNFGGFPEGFGYGDIPDPSDRRTFKSCQLDWREADRPEAQAWRATLKGLLKTRATYIVPLMKRRTKGGKVQQSPERCLFVDWAYPGGVLSLRANLSDHRVAIEDNPGIKIHPGGLPEDYPWLHPYSVRIFVSGQHA